MLAVKRLTGVAPEVNRGFHCIQMMKQAGQGIYPGSETQGRGHQKFKKGVSVVT